MMTITRRAQDSCSGWRLQTLPVALSTGARKGHCNVSTADCKVTMHVHNARPAGMSLRDVKVGAQPEVGDVVKAKWKGIRLIIIIFNKSDFTHKGSYFAGRIQTVNLDSTYTVAFDDGNTKNDQENKPDSFLQSTRYFDLNNRTLGNNG